MSAATKYKVKATEKRKRKAATSSKSGIYTIRLNPDMVVRLDRLVDWMAPRVMAMTGKATNRSDVIRAVMLRGITATEKEFGLQEPAVGYVLVDDDG